MIRRAGLDDIPQIVELGLAFHAASPYAEFPADPAALADVAQGLIERGAVFLSDDGMIGGILSPLYFNPSVVMAAELFWWAPKEGRALREAFEAWAKGQGAAGVQFSGLVNARAQTVTRLFQRAGYRPAELAFYKRF